MAEFTNGPNRDGYWWAKWKIASPGTFQNQEEESAEMSDHWRVVEVWSNGGQGPEEWGVDVPGYSKMQFSDQFFWGPFVGNEPGNLVECAENAEPLLKRMFDSAPPWDRDPIDKVRHNLSMAVIKAKRGGR